MTRKLIRLASAITATILLLTAFGALAVSAEATDEIVNVLVIAGEDMGDTVFPIVPMLLSFNLTTRSVRYVFFYFETQIYAVAKNGDAVSIPMCLLTNCDTDEIVKAYENTFGVAVDRYLLYQYQYGSYSPIVDVYDLLFPITVDVPEELLGTERYTTINGKMKDFANTMGRGYTEVLEAGPQALDAVGYLAYFSAVPDSIWASGDWLTMSMEDYRYWDIKNRAVLDGLRTVIGLLSPDTEYMLLQMLVKDQITDITAEDIAAWSAAGLNIDTQSPYLSVPGFEGIERKVGDIGTLQYINAYQNQMLAYDNEAVRRQIHTFLYGP